MSLYQATKQLRSAKVTVRLLRDIERYLVSSLNKVHGPDKSGLETAISISDQFGTETFTSIDQYVRETLHNNTTAVEIDISQVNEERVRVQIIFGIHRYQNKIRVQVEGENAYERTMGFFNSIDRLISEHKNFNFLFHGAWEYGAAGMLGVAISGFLLSLFFEAHRLAVVSLILMSLFALFLLLKLVSPYCAFDSNSNQRTEHVTKWILNGFATVFVFGVIAYYLREKILGF